MRTSKFLSAPLLMFGLLGYSSLSSSNQNDSSSFHFSEIENGTEYFYNKESNRVEYWLPINTQYNILKSSGTSEYFIGINIFIDLTKNDESKQILSTLYPQTPIVMGGKRKVMFVNPNIPELQSELKTLLSTNSIEYQSTIPISKQSFDILMGPDHSGSHLNLEINTKFNIERKSDNFKEYKVNDYCVAVKSKFGTKISAKEIIKEVSLLYNEESIKKMNSESQALLIDAIFSDCFALGENLTSESNNSFYIRNTFLTELLFSTSESQTVIKEILGESITKNVEVNRTLNLKIQFSGVSEI
jgi:hypothetical protein